MPIKYVLNTRARARCYEISQAKFIFVCDVNEQQARNRLPVENFVDFLSTIIMIIMIHTSLNTHYSLSLDATLMISQCTLLLALLSELVYSSYEQLNDINVCIILCPYQSRSTVYFVSLYLSLTLSLLTHSLAYTLSQFWSSHASQPVYCYFIWTHYIVYYLYFCLFENLLQLWI